MDYRLYLYIITQMFTSGRASVFFDGENVEFFLDEESGNWIVSSLLISSTKSSKKILKELFPRKCKARFTSKESFLFWEEGETLVLRGAFSKGDRYVVFREQLSFFLQELEDWRTILSN